ncbi:MAG: TetR/AcrR family transcriptional regulator [Acidimicrobiaceae bacterium]|nr:TetR/AcrR family transcriptional regulator [Acidimicrobiaceae bacterium]
MTQSDGPIGNLEGMEAVRAARIEWRLGQILSAATKLLSEQGFQKMLITDLAREAGVSVGTIYQYVNTKEDILLLVVNDIIESYRREVPAAMEGIEDPVERLAAGFSAYCLVVDSHRTGALLAYQESKSMSRVGRERLMQLEVETNSYFSDCIRDGVRTGKFVPVDPAVVSATLTMMAHMWALKHWYLSAMFDVNSYTRNQLSLITKALVAVEFQNGYAHLVDHI